KNKKYESSKNNPINYLQSYVSKAIKTEAIRKIYDYNNVLSRLHHICPDCKYYNNKEFLIVINDNLFCKECEKNIEYFSSEIKKQKRSEILSKIKTRKSLHEAFLYHSKTGSKCPDCSRFIPDSYYNEYEACPDPDRGWFGDKLLLQKKNHPKSLKRAVQYITDLSSAASNK